jgi:PIN domain nuclease of toxin-antitoxin system
VKVLIDSHTFLWFVEDSPRLSTTASALLEDLGNEVFLSIASVWELSIKANIGRLQFGLPFDSFMQLHLFENEIQLLDVSFQHTLHYVTLPVFAEHKDPFDRMLIAQAMYEKMPLVSYDQKFDQYDVERIW